MGNEYILKKTDLDEKWDKFVQLSANGTAFSYSEYLKNINANTTVYYCLKSEEARAAVAIVESKDKKDSVLHDFVIYNGIMFAPLANKQNNSQVLSEYFKIATFIAGELAKIYKTVNISLHHSITDIRPFLWFNYGTAQPKYEPTIMYTSRVHIGDFNKDLKNEDITLFLNASSSRRQEIRYAVKKGVITKKEFEADYFVDFYDKTMKRQNIEVENNVLDEMKTLITGLFEVGLGEMFVSYTAKGDVGSMAFFCFDNKRAYYLFGANDPDLRDSHTGTAVLWDSFQYLSQDGIKEVDLEGVNSPKRGWFKLSFGGTLETYFKLCLKQ